MAIDTVKSVVKRFLRSKSPEVVVIKGGWGVGKTFTWRRILEDHKGDIVGVTRYSYVSLFGIQSIAELRTAIFTRSVEIDLIGKQVDWELVNKKWMEVLWSKSTQFAHWLQDAVGAMGSYGRVITIGLDKIAGSLTRNMLICLDDFERSSLRADDVLGLISELKEERGCKIVVLFNHEQLGERAVAYSSFREKVVDIELLFNPAPGEAVDWALPADLPMRAEISDFCSLLELRNIRVMRRMAEIWRLLYEHASHLHERVQSQIAQAAVIGTWCSFDKSGRAPSIGYLRMFGRGEAPDSEDDVSDDDRRWSALLHEAGFVMFDELDAAILDVIDRGYVEETAFIAEAAAQDQRCRAGDENRDWESAWNLFQNSFENNEAELVERLDVATRNFMTHISIIKLDRTVALLRELGEGRRADNLVEEFVGARRDTPEIFELSEYAFAERPADPYLISRFNALSQQQTTLVSLRDAVTQHVNAGGWGRDHELAVRAASSNDFYAFFKDPGSIGVDRAVGACQRASTWEDGAAIASKVTEALQRLGREGNLNAIRVKRFGVHVQAP